MKAIIFVLALCAIIAGSRLTAQTETVEVATKAQIRATLREILDSTFQQAAQRNADGSIKFVNYERLHITDDNRKRVRSFGNVAVSVLREYVSDGEGWRQQAAIELLGEFRSEEALTALVYFADHSRVRYVAIPYINEYPIGKTRAILRRFLSDPEPLVRDAAKRALDANGEK
jgi:hypothetical protein